MTSMNGKLVSVDKAGNVYAGGEKVGDGLRSFGGRVEFTAMPDCYDKDERLDDEGGPELAVEKPYLPPMRALTFPEQPLLASPAKMASAAAYCDMVRKSHHEFGLPAPVFEAPKTKWTLAELDLVPRAELTAALARVADLEAKETGCPCAQCSRDGALFLREWFCEEHALIRMMDLERALEATQREPEPESHDAGAGLLTVHEGVTNRWGR